MPDDAQIVSGREAYEALLPTLQAMPGERVRRPHRRVQHYVIDAQDLAVTAEPDRAMFEGLAAAGYFDIDCLTQIEQRALALRHAQSRWVAVYDPSLSAEAKARLERAAVVRRTLLEDLDFAAIRLDRNGQIDDGKSLRRALELVREGSGRADLIADLSDLAHLAERWAEALARVGHDAPLGAEADVLSTELGRQFDADKPDAQAAMDLRNRAFTLLHEAIVEIRETGFWLHRYAPEQRTAYKSPTHKPQGSAGAPAPAPEEEAAPPSE